jgi:hypothetical protein
MQRYWPTWLRWGRGTVTTVAAFLIAIPIVAGVILQSNYNDAAGKDAAEYSRYAEQEVGESCRGVAEIELVHCFSDARIKGELKKREYEHDAQDLVAQKTSALWTMLMGLAAILGMGLSVVGVYLVWTTFKETRHANEIAKADQRAWVRLSADPRLAREIRKGTLYLRINCVAENTGRSPATFFAIEAKVFFLGRNEASAVVEDEMLKQIEEWKADYRGFEKAVLLPNDTEEYQIWNTFSGDEVKWWDSPFFPKSVAPLLLTAVFYRTTALPDIVQLSWRSWYLVSIDKDGQLHNRIILRDDDLGPNELRADTFHASLIHEEFRVIDADAEKDEEPEHHPVPPIGKNLAESE